MTSRVVADSVKSALGTVDQTPTPTPSGSGPVFRVYRPTHRNDPDIITAAGVWEDIPGLRVSFGGAYEEPHSMQGMMHVMVTGTNFSADNLQIRVILETDAGDEVLPELAGNDYIVDYSSTATLAWRAPASAGNLFLAVRGQWQVNGNGGQRSQLVSAELQALEVEWPEF